MLINPEKVIPMVAAVASGHDFTEPMLGKAFDSIVTLNSAGVSLLDPTIALRELKSAGIGNAVEILKQTQSIPNVSGALFHAERVRNFARLRSIVDTGDALRERITEPKVKADDVLGWLEGQMRMLRGGAVSEARFFDRVVDDVIEDFRRRIDDPEPAVLLSGLPGADRAGFVFGTGELCILAARPGVGKTSLATQIAMHHAVRNRPVLFASLEMRDRDLVSRVLMASAGLNHQSIRTGTVDHACIEDMKAAQDRLGKPPLFVWSPGRVKAGMIHATASVLKATYGLRLVIVDYIGLVRADDPGKQRYEQVGEIAKALRDIGQHLQIPVLCLAQLNREADGAEPKLSNLRESGDIEQDADVVGFLHQPDNRDKTRVELIVAKDRQGAAGRAPLLFHPEQTRFEDESNEWKP